MSLHDLGVVAYLDNAATTDMDPEAIEAMLPFFSGRHGNPSGVHRVARVARRALDDARDELGSALGCLGREIVFTSGGTESDNLALKGATGDVGRLITTAFEHRAVLEPARSLGARIAPVDASGIVDLDALSELLDESVDLVSVMAVNNEVGTVQPIGRVVEVVRDRSPNALVHCDAAQALSFTDLAASSGECDLVTISAHKFGGPKGIGALVVRERAAKRLQPILHGGGQEHELRAGTQNVAGAVAMARAAAVAARDRDANISRVTMLRDRLEEGLLSNVQGTTVSAPREFRSPALCPMRFAGVISEELVLLLDSHGVCASAGSSCASGALEPSHVLLAMGVPAAEAKGALRLSLGKDTEEDEIEAALSVIAADVAFLRNGI